MQPDLRPSPFPTVPMDPDVLDAMLDQAEADLGAGRLDAARQVLEQVLQQDPQQFDALHLLGVIALQRKDFAKGAELIEQALAMDPDVDMAQVNLGAARLEMKQPEKALACFDKAISLAPDYVEAHFGRGCALQAMSQWPQAVQSFAQVLALQPGHVEALASQGAALYGWQHYDEAIVALDKALALQPQHVAALINRGYALSELQRYEEALASYDQVILLKVERPAVYALRGDALLALGRMEYALASFDRALTLQPDQFAVWANRGNALLKLRRLNEAAASFDKALSYQPQHSDVQSNLAGAWREAGRLQEALTLCDRVLQSHPHHAGAWQNKGNALMDQGRLTEAREAFAKASSLQPDNAEARWSQGWVATLQGDWATGLPLLEWRWKKAHIASAKRAFIQPQWDGQADLRGRTILLHAEQGLGDTIQFCRYVTQVAALGARVVLEVQPPLVHLMSSLDGVAQIVAQGQALPAFDTHCPLMSLPMAFKTTPDTVPTVPAYLTADPALVQRMANRLGANVKQRVGLVWSGNAMHRDDHNRSMPLATLLDALPQGPQFYVLQKDIRDSDMATLRARHDVILLEDALQDFDATAALVAQMDVVISVDTSIAHLAGALGKPVWLLLAKMPDWRWLLQRHDTPWYPATRLFRQITAGQWADPLRDVGQALTARAMH
ncbi:MAG: tetratricopeptide repeat protein [Aquabacterium sp.]|uniref:tetratricopeptide repeat protein n=1 Tax=Aquabacterium sp. TaxID=1872578 RepID=UPI00122BCF5F|nr:tetratricopeptide repeat protein [Aquabacterium sp.]TAK96786.1 MAG: tetratricopeptide repeat protein [Aquabacterium sp.]